tara:strand:- start:15 stop:848 length:834 start_codon:yes stop_codon:yes gene_type:complete
MIKGLILILFFMLNCSGRTESYLWVKSLPAPWTLTEIQFEKYLVQFQDHYPDFFDRLKAMNYWRVGTPYGIYCLGEEKGVDDDPIIRYDSSDCTVHILTTLAFAQSSTWDEARQRMIDIHYKEDLDNNKKPDFNKRWHFTSDRILNHHQTIDITLSVSNPKDIEQLNIILNQKEDGKQFLDLDWTSEEDISFIPIEKLDYEIIKRLPSICGVSFVKRSYFKLGIVIAHEGYLIDQTNLIHASSEFGKTVNVDFYNYLKKDNKYKFDGVMFFKIRNNG